MSVRFSSRVAVLLLLACVFWCLSCGRGTVETPTAEPPRTIYVVNEDDDTVSVIDSVTRSVVTTIPVGKWPHYIALDPTGKHAYITNGDSNSISVIDTATNRVVSTIGGVAADPQQIAIHPAGRFAYVPGYDSGNVQVIDLVAGRIEGTISVGESPQSIAISPDGGRVYVVNLHSPEAMVIDTATNKIIATFTTGEGACGIAASPDGRYLYLGGHGVGMWAKRGEKNRDIRVFDARTLEQLSVIGCGIMPIAVRFSRDGKQAYVASHGSGELHIIDTAANKATSVKVGNDCRDMVGTTDGKWVYVSNRGDNTVSVVDVTAKKVVATIGVGRGPVGIAIKEVTTEVVY